MQSKLINYIFISADSGTFFLSKFQQLKVFMFGQIIYFELLTPFKYSFDKSKTINSIIKSNFNKVIEDEIEKGIN